jgi:hypothetical protein
VTPAQLRHRIGGRGSRPISPKERVALLLLTDDALLALYRLVTGPAVNGKTCAELSAELHGLCRYDHVKAMLRMLGTLVREQRGGYPDGQRRSKDGKFLSMVDVQDIPIDLRMRVRQWVATGVDLKTATRWAKEMGASEGLT